MFRHASELTAALDDLQEHVTHALQIDPSTSAVNASGEILGRVQKAKNICSAICDATLKQSPLAAMAQDQLGSPKKGKGVHGFVKAVYTPSPPRPEDEQRRMADAARFTQQLQVRCGQLQSMLTERDDMIAVLEDSLLALWAQANGNAPPPSSLLKGQLLSASEAGGGSKHSPSKSGVSSSKHKDLAALSMLKGELDSRLRTFMNNMAPSPLPESDAIPLAVVPRPRSRDASSRHLSPLRTSSPSPVSRPRSRALPPLTHAPNAAATGGMAEEFDPQAELEAASRLSRVLQAVGAAVAAGGSAAAAATAASHAAAEAVVTGAGRAGSCVMFSEIEESSRPITGLAAQIDANVDSDGVRSITPATPLSAIPPPSRGGTVLGDGGGAGVGNGGECWAALGAVVSNIESALAEELGCRWVCVLPVSSSLFDAWVSAAKHLAGQTKLISAPPLRLQGLALKQQLKHDDDLLTYPISLMKCARLRPSPSNPPLPPHVRIQSRLRQPLPEGAAKVVEVGGGALATALEFLGGGGGSRLAGLQSVLKGSVDSAAAAMEQKQYICNAEDALHTAWNSDDAALLGSSSPQSFMVVPLVAGAGAPGEGQLQALAVCGGKMGGFHPPHAALIRGASSSILSAIHTGMQLSCSARCAALSSGARSALQALLSSPMSDAAAISHAVAKWLPQCIPTVSNALLFMSPEISPSVSKAAAHHRLALNPKPNAPEREVFFYCSSSSVKLMPFVQDQSAIALALLHNRPLIGVCPIKSMLFAQLLKDAKIAAALAPTPAAPSTPANQVRSSSERLIFGSEQSAGDNDPDDAAAGGLREDTPGQDSEAGSGVGPKVASGIFKAMAKIAAPDHSFIILVPVGSVAVLAIEVCDGACPDADLLEALRGIGACINRCIDMAGVFESCNGSSKRMSAIASTGMTQAHSALLKAAKRLLQCSVVQIYDVEWSHVGSGSRASDQIPFIRCITPDNTQTGARGPPLPPGVGVVWRAVVRAELVLVRRCADDAVFRRGIDCPYECNAESAIVSPCVVEGQVVGAVSFVNKRSGLFLLGDTLAAEMLSRGVAISIAAAREIASERARAEEVVRGMSKHCASLVRTAGYVKDVVRQGGVDTCIRHFQEQFPALLECEQVILWIFNPQRSTMEYRPHDEAMLSRCHVQENGGVIEMALDECPAGRVVTLAQEGQLLEEGIVLRADEPGDARVLSLCDLRYVKNPTGMFSSLCIPVFNDRANVVAVLEALNPVGNVWSMPAVSISILKSSAVLLSESLESMISEPNLLTGGSSLLDLIEESKRLLCRLFSCKYAALYLLNSTPGPNADMIVHRSAGTGARAVRMLRTTGLAGRVQLMDSGILNISDLNPKDPRYSAEVHAALDLPKPTNVLCAVVWPSEVERQRGADTAIAVIELFGRMSTKPFTRQDEVKLTEWASKFGALLSCVQLSTSSIRRIGRVDDVEQMFFQIKNYMAASASALLDAGKKLSSINEMQTWWTGVAKDDALKRVFNDPHVTAAVLRLCLLMRVVEEGLLTLIDVGGVTVHVYNARFSNVTFRRAKPVRTISPLTGAFDSKVSKLLPHFQGEGSKKCSVKAGAWGEQWDVIEPGGESLLRDVFGGNLAVVSEPANWAAGQACSAKKVLLYDDVASALSANFEALKAQEETARYPVAKTKSAASIPILAAGGTVVGCFMLHNKLDCGVQYIGKLSKDSTGEPRSIVIGAAGVPCTIASFSNEDVEIVERLANLVSELLLTDEKTLAVLMLLQQKMGKHLGV